MSLNHLTMYTTTPTVHAVGVVIWLGDPTFASPDWAAFTSVGLHVLEAEGGPWWHERGNTSPLSLLRNDIIPSLCEHYHLPIALAGHGRGGAGALTLSFRLKGEVVAVYADSSAIDLHESYGEGSELDTLYPSREACRQDGAILAVNPFHYPACIRFSCSETHPYYRGNDRLHEKLTALGIPHQFTETPSPADELARELKRLGRRLL